MNKAKRTISPVKIALFLLLAGLLLGSLLRGKMAVDARRTQLLEDQLRIVAHALHEYRSQFKALPGDELDVRNAASYLVHADSCAPVSNKCMLGNGVIDGNWNDENTTSESYLAWQHLRLAGLLEGATDPASATYLPKNNEGGRIGITGKNNTPINGLRGPQIICTDHVKASIAKKIDADFDDGDTASGKMMVTRSGTLTDGVPIATDALADDGYYLLCVSTDAAQGN